MNNVPDRSTIKWYSKAEMSMSKNTSIVLGKEQEKFIQKQVKKGRSGSASEAIIEGETSGTATPFDMSDFVKSKRSAST